MTRRYGGMGRVLPWMQTIKTLKDELEKWGAEYILPTKFGAGQELGVVTLEFALNGKWTKVSCKRWQYERDGADKNLRAITSAVEAARKAHQRGIGELFAQVASANLSLPPPSGEPTGNAAPSLSSYDVLGVSRTASRAVMKAAYRQRLKETHTDTGAVADAEQFKRVQEAAKELGLVDSQGHLIVDIGTNNKVDTE